MYAILNLAVFLGISGYAFALMFSKPSYVKLSKKEKVLLTGREKFLLLTLVTGMVSVGGATIGVNLSALRLMLWIFMMLLAFLLFRKAPKPFNKLTLVYIVFLLWLAVSLLWAPSLTYGVRVYLKYLYPFVALFFAATFVQSKEFIFIAMRWMLVAAFVCSLFLGGLMTHVLGVWSFYFGGVFWPMSTLADYLAVMSAVSMVMWWRTKEKKYLLLIAWFVLSALLQSVRTGLLSIGVMFMVWSYLRFKLAALPFIVGALFMGVAMILFIPSLKEKMFYSTESVQSISDMTSAFDDNNLNTSARSGMWEHLLFRFHNNHEWLGSGLGSVQQYMYENFVFGGLQVPHSDYVQLMSDVGNIGLLLYLLFPLSVYLFARKQAHKGPSTALITSAILAVLSYAAILPAMGFDNVVNYSFAVHSYPFIFVGIFLAYKRQDRRKGVHNV